MRVGVYVDAFNLYYGAKEMMGSTAGWRWLDIRKLAERYAQWGGASVDRVVYCTARVNDADDPSQARRQGFYLDALGDSGSIDVLEEGYYSSWAKESAMTNEPLGTPEPDATHGQAPPVGLVRRPPPPADQGGRHTCHSPETRGEGV